MDTNRTIDISLDGGSVIAEGENSHGVQVGTVSQGKVILAAEFDSDGYRKQTVTVNGRVTGGTGTAAGVYLAGGGRVVIGPRGSVGAKSGIAILATGDTPAADPQDPAIQPKLRVDMNLGGRRVEQAIGDNWIINDGGETTIAVNNVVLHEGATGVTGRTVAKGARNVTMREHGVKVDDRSAADPVEWMLTESTSGDKIIADRDFSVQDFIEEYAPRAALYETLPGFLLRMAEQGPLDNRLVSKQSPVWMAFSGGSGSVDPSRSTTGADYDYDRYMVQLGKNLTFGEDLDGWFAIHYTQGDSDVSSPTGGGDIDADGAGATFDIQWHHSSGYYLNGRASITDYDIDLSSDEQGRLRNSVDALGVSLGIETGRRMAMGENLNLTPRAWLSHSSIDIDSFTDAVDAQASFPDEVRFTGGIGASVETLRDWKGGELTWHGSLDIEQMLNSRRTTANVSGEKLKSETISTRVLLGLGSLYQKGDFSISGQVAASGLDTNDEEYSVQINIGLRL